MGKSSEKVVPLPSSLDTCSVPCIKSTSRLQMARPRPVPPYLRVVEASACMNCSKSELSFCGGIPMPVSSTLIWRMPAVLFVRSIETRVRTEPCSVNLTELPSRLSRIWRDGRGRQ